MTAPLTPRTDGDASPVPRRHGIDCNEAQEIIPAFALGVAETAERLLLLAHCQQCAACADTLAESRRTTAFLPFAAPVSVPDPHAKSALFARIAATPVTVATGTMVQPAISDSPLAKQDSRLRSKPAAASSTQPTFWFNTPLAKYAVAPLAIALMLVGFYALRPVTDQPASETVTSVAESTGAASAALIPTVASSARGTDARAASIIDPDDTNLFAGTSTTPDSSGLVATFVSQPIYAMSARSNSSNTESARAIAPNDGMCRLSSLTPGNYHLSVSGINLPDGNGDAGIYLTTHTGIRTLIARISIDRFGNGETDFHLDQPMSRYAAVLIGPLEDGGSTARPLKDAATFTLSSSDQFSTIERTVST